MEDVNVVIEESNDRLTDGPMNEFLGVFLFVMAGFLLCVVLLGFAYWRQHRNGGGHQIAHSSEEFNDPSHESVLKGLIVFRWNANSTVELGQESSKPPACALCSKAFQRGEEIGKSNNPDCNHVHHGDCLVHWLQLQNTCPTCNKPYVLMEKV
ncbi:RING-H2 finger protein [Seminavis robusta]|uniref:RING-H2 finger protein n=1 Tax=Seminavis robusta TaxID=568900 RepID=A0A9N8DAH8_9STRA|nr:RING-H2 finger protein [Seminavis robusta]|eukprot:Sro57_g033510.1 RING-H2 finger protein (153) ;mRNA; f:128107-128819